MLSGLSVALIAVGAAIVFPLGPIPFTLQTLMLMLALLILTPKEALATTGGYLLLGIIGLPVFSGFTGGFGVFLGPTGGFLMGFLAGVALVAPLRALLQKRLLQTRSAMFLDLASVLLLMGVYYSTGMAWFMVVTGSSATAALALCVLPFVIPDIIKAAAAIACARPIRVALGR